MEPKPSCAKGGQQNERSAECGPQQNSSKEIEQQHEKGEGIAEVEQQHAVGEGIAEVEQQHEGLAEGELHACFTS